MILGVSGRLQSGKNTACNYILGKTLQKHKVIDDFEIDKLGRLAPFIDGHYKEYDDWKICPEIVSLYSFADPLKELCINLLGLTKEQCWGTDEEKNSLTKLKWEDMPGIISAFDFASKKGPMTAREVMQFVGTNIFRKMSNNVWVDATIRKIQATRPKLALICDIRFPNEVEGVQKAGGKVIRLTRHKKTGTEKDNHYSETALDKENFDWSKFDFVLDNKNMTIEEQNKATDEILHRLSL